jgi:hypothetical protein
MPPMEPETQQPLTGDLRGRILAIERSVDGGTYRPGPWHALVRDIRNSMFFERAAVADDVSRVSRKLHLRRGRRWLSMNTGILLEMVATMVGAGLIIAGAATRSNLLAAIGAVVWMTTFQPLIKLMAGRLLGVEYDYFYLWAIEPRIKMRYGTYLTRPRFFRVIVHLAGTIGSPLAAYLAYLMLAQSLPGAATFCLVAFWIVVVINVVNFIAALLGAHRLGPLPLSLSSAGSAAQEIREGLGL